jgi:hypothetical protein
LVGRLRPPPPEEPVAAIGEDGFIDEPQPASLASQPPRQAGRNADEDELAAGGRRKKRTSSRSRQAGKAKNPQDYEEQQPVSNESALHQSSPGYSPAPTAPIGVIAGQGVDRTASMRLRWQ